MDNTLFPLANRDLRARLDMIIYDMPHFWEQRPYVHFTNQGPEHSERILYQKIAQLAQELSIEQRLSEDEIFILSAAAWLYEIGMQSTHLLRPTLDFTFEPGVALNTDQLLLIRKHRNTLTRQLIMDCVRNDYDGPPLRIGLTRPADDYIQAIAEVCYWCSDEPLDRVNLTIPVSGVLVRLRLLVALLRLADQLYIDSTRVNLDRLLAFPLPPREKAYWWAYHYTQILPIDKGKIRFYYFLPITQRQYLGHIRALIEPTFEYANNATMRFLLDEHGLKLTVQKQPQVRLDQQSGFLLEMPPDMLQYLIEMVETNYDAMDVQIEPELGSLVTAHRLERVFVRSGFPKVTFVEREDFIFIKLALQEAGRGIIIEGPSGVGKTTAIKKAIQDLEETNALSPLAIEQVLSARNPADRALLQTVRRWHHGIVIIDDFHRLDHSQRNEIIDYLKELADAGSQTKKIVIIGIPRTGQALVHTSFDIAMRLDRFKFGRVKDELILHMIEKGERALNISFDRKAEIVSAAHGSLNLAQFICYNLCALTGVMMAQDVNFGIPWVKF